MFLVFINLVGTDETTPSEPSSYDNVNFFVIIIYIILTLFDVLFCLFFLPASKMSWSLNNKDPADSLHSGPVNRSRVAGSWGFSPR